jgi:hypothetical protein
MSRNRFKEEQGMEQREREDRFNESEKDTTATGTDLPNADGSVSDEDVQAVKGENQDGPTGQDRSTENYADRMPTEGVGAVQHENDTLSDVARIDDEE